jgi:hypothetical protein
MSVAKDRRNKPDKKETETNSATTHTAGSFFRKCLKILKML